MDINKKVIVKGIASFVLASSVSAVISQVIKNNLPVNMKPLDKVFVGIGSFVIMGMAEVAAAKYVNEIFDTVKEPQPLVIVIPAPEDPEK